jgi:general secretion pathway protein E
VLATLHTNSAAGAVTRLVDMGIEPYLLASTLSGVLAQRLVRKVNQEDKTKFRGRTGIYELLTVNEYIRTLIHDGKSEAEIAIAASHAGMKTLREDGTRWVESGVTSLEEVIRVTRD